MVTEMIQSPNKQIQQTGTKEIQEKAHLGEKGGLLEIVQEIKI